jgi:hypothetical protein
MRQQDGHHHRSRFPRKGVIVFKKIVAPVIIGGVLLGGIAGGGVAYAATTATTPTHTTTTGTGKVAMWVRDHRRELRRAGVDISAKTIGITPQALRSDLKAGNSVAGVATAHGVSSQTVVNALVTAADARVAKAVSAGKLSSTQANAVDAKIPAAATKLVNRTF